MTPSLLAGLAVGLHLATWHSEPGFESVTPGWYLRTGSGWTAGAYRNSYGRASVYAGRTWQTADGRWALTAAGVTGYPQAAVRVVAVPSVRLGNGAAAARLAYLPKPPGGHGTHTVHLALERHF